MEAWTETMAATTAHQMVAEMGLSDAVQEIQQMDAVSYAQMRCNWLNESVGTLTGYDCPKCRNKGYIAVLRDGYEICQECSCMAIRKCRKNVQDSGLSEALERLTFDRYQCTEAWQERAKAAAMHYAEQKRQQWFYMGGQSGAGKTHLCTAICGELLSRGVQVRYEMWRTVCRDLIQFRTQQERFAQLAEAEVLYVDDFLKSADPRKEIGIAFDILNERYAKGKPTILSSEYLLDDLFQLDSALAGRIRERCGGYLIQIAKDDGRNWRMTGNHGV